MLRRTHLAIGAAVALYFLPHVNNQLAFIPILIISTLLPDMDRIIGPSKLMFWKKDSSETPNHRGMFHSYTFCILLSVLFAFFSPLLALPFFLGYSTHLFADSFTVKGIKPFWPLKVTSSGKVSTGGTLEITVFWVFILVDLFILVFLFI